MQTNLDDTKARRRCTQLQPRAGLSPDGRLIRHVIDGMGFHPGMNLTIGSTSAAIVSTTSNQLLSVAPSKGDGVQTITISDAITGGSTVLNSALTYGAGPDDTLSLIVGSNPQTPAGTEAINPMRVRVIGPDGVPVVGATAVFTSSPAVILSSCSGAATCTLLTDESGEAATRLTPLPLGFSVSLRR